MGPVEGEVLASATVCHRRTEVMNLSICERVAE